MKSALAFQSAKVFGVGLNKTGTTTLRLCARILGYRTVGCDRDLLSDVVSRRDLSRLIAVARRHSFMSDWPWPLVYKEMDTVFPESQFVLTTRLTEEGWFASLSAHSLESTPFRNCRKLAYGYSYPHRHRQQHLDFYRRHNDAVRSYFASRPGRLLEVCWERGDDWRVLCDFLERRRPALPFPHANRSERRDKYPVLWIVNRILSLSGI